MALEAEFRATSYEFQVEGQRTGSHLRETK